MEDILEKNIFNDKELLKLSPDYNPSELILRMQMRRSLIKDTHCHRLHKTPIQRKKSVTTTATDNTIINKEIVKLKDAYETDNIKNEFNLKNNKLLPKNRNVERTFNFNNNNAQSVKELGLYNDVKETRDTENIVYRFGDTEISDISCLGVTVRPIRNYAFNIDHVTNKIHISGLATDNDFSFKEENYIKTSISIPTIEKIDNDSIFKGPVDDLQSLLIKMAITSIPDDETGDNNVMEAENNDIEKEIIVDKQLQRPDSIKNHEMVDYLKVQPLKTRLKKREIYLVSKYLQIWKINVANKKEQFRLATLNSFFDKLEKKKNNLNTNDPAYKAKVTARDYSNYQHRYKMQKHIIALQKAKLEEQHRLIDELKYNKIVDASKQSVEAMKDEIRRTYYEIDRHLKPKIKCLTNELKIPEIEEPSLVLHCLKVPQFLQRMEKRAREREEKHAMIRERRRQMEEERIRIKQQADLAKLEMDKEEKLKRMVELREKRKRERLESIRKKQHTERLRALTVMAELHYERSILNSCGLKPWKRLIEMKRDNVEKAKAHYRFQLAKNVFLHWMWHTEDMWYERNYRAEDLYRKKLLRKCFRGFKEHHHTFTLKRQVAEDYHDYYLVKVVFRKFREGIEVVRREQAVQWQRAVDYHECNLTFKTFVCWRSLPALNAVRRERELRKARWREKVLQVVPDYIPPED